MPTLILSGADDLRTPTANAREVAAQIPGVQLLVVPNTGHSVLDSDPTQLLEQRAAGAVRGQADQALRDPRRRRCCAPRRSRRRAWPTSRPATRQPRQAGQDARARSSLTLADFDRQLALQALAQLGSSSLAALSSRAASAACAPAGPSSRRAGSRCTATPTCPGVTVSGVITASQAELSVGGAAAARGALRVRFGTERRSAGALEGGDASRELRRRAAGRPIAAAGHCTARDASAERYLAQALGTLAANVSGCPHGSLRLTLATALLAARSRSSASRQPGALAFTPCANSPGFTCATLPVPLDRASGMPGTISLSVERRLAGAAPSHDAVLALAGGPGQAALPLGEFIAQATRAGARNPRPARLRPARHRRSDPLTARRSSSFCRRASVEPAVRTVRASDRARARRLHDRRNRSQTSRRCGEATGYEKLVLYGTSYGTKVALEYAERYPQNVEALVLDSVVPTDGPEPFAIPSFQAIGPVLAELCSERACAGITSNPLADLARLTAQLRKHALERLGLRRLRPAAHGHAQRGRPARHPRGGRPEPGPARAAARRRALGAAPRPRSAAAPAPALGGADPQRARQPAGEEGQTGIDEALFVTPPARRRRFPWQRTALARDAARRSARVLHAQPARDFYPFDASTACATASSRDCADWPDASPPPPRPTGAAERAHPDPLRRAGPEDPDLERPRVAALIPDAQLVVVPYTGHSVLGSDFSGCAERAVKAFFAGAPVQPCATTTNPFAPTPITPTQARLRAPAAAGSRGKPGQHAHRGARHDRRPQPPGHRRHAAGRPAAAERLELRRPARRLRQAHHLGGDPQDLSFVPGVELSGTFPVRNGKLQPATIRVSGSEASPGTVRIGSGTRVTGTLAGRHFNVSLAKVKLSRVARRRRVARAAARRAAAHPPALTRKHRPALARR